jgi:formyl-CoA transferase
VACGNDSQFRKLTQASGSPELATDPRFVSNPARVRNRDVLVPLLETLMLQRKRDEWIALLESAGVPCGPINDLADVFQDPQVLARQMQQEIPHPTAGHISVPGSALKMSVTPVTYRNAPPLLGQHTDEVLQSLAATSEAELADMKSRKII